jgi:protein-tyrosine-phosphatase
MNIEAITVESTVLRRRAAVHAALADEHRLALVELLHVSDRTPGDLAELVGLGSNLVAHHLGVLEAAGLVARSRSEGDARRRYVTLLVAPDEVLAPGPRLVAREVLFVCTRNAARSQLAAALWHARTGLPARSAGAAPAGAVDAGAVAVAGELDIDLSAAVPQGWHDLDAAPDLVVSVCDRAHEAGPPFDVPLVHWSVPDPADHDRAAHRAVVAQLADRVERLARQVGA